MNWYPGHMKKTYEMLKENLRVVDLVIIILDSRIPRSSLNPKLDKLINNKEKIYLMNKADISDQQVNKIWMEYFKRKNIFMTLSTIISAIVNLIGNLILVPKYGALGAAIATALSYIVFFWCRTLISNFLWKSTSLTYHLITHIIIVLMLIELYFSGSLSMLWLLVIFLLNYKTLFNTIKHRSCFLK